MTTMGDQVTFCATSLLVSAAIATLEWDALALSPAMTQSFSACCRCRAAKSFEPR